MSHLPSSSPDSDDDESGKERWKSFHKEPGSGWISPHTFLLNYPSKADAGPPQVTSLVTADSSGPALPVNSPNKVVPGS